MYYLIELVTMLQYIEKGDPMMSQVIRISDDLYKRLEALASGFDTPSNVIEAILDAYENTTSAPLPSIRSSVNSKIQPADNLEIVYFSGSEEDFKQELLSCKKAYIKIHYTDNTSEIKEWSASKLSATSHVDGNLRSGYLRGWKKRGIFKAELSTLQNEIVYST